MSDLDLSLAMDVARRAAEAGAAASLAYFRAGVRVEVKPDRSPVTQADRDSEAAILAAVRAAFPEHGFLGEETGTHQGGAAGTRWIVDPLDGTRGFTRGGPFWGPLVALEHGGRVVAGAMALPVLGEVYWAARGLGCWVAAGGGAPARLRVSGIGSWADATLSFGEPRLLLAPPLLERLGGLGTSCASARCYGDLAGCALVLRGQAEAWVEAGVKIWDIAALQILVEEAGGRFTDLAGNPTHASGNCLASNGLVHEHVLAALAGGGARPDAPAPGASPTLGHDGGSKRLSRRREARARRSHPGSSHMDELRVPKHRISAEVLLPGGVSRRMALFLAEAAPDHDGPERPLDLLNGRGEFIPALDEDAGQMDFLNRATLAAVRIPHETEPDEPPTIPTEHEVELLLADGAVLRGLVSYVRPKPQERLVDFLNESPPFFPLLEEGAVVLVNRHHVARVALLDREP